MNEEAKDPFNALQPALVSWACAYSEWRDQKESFSKFIAALDAAGYAIVPVPPTPEMVTAGGAEFLPYDSPDGNAKLIYAAMVAAGAVKP